MGKCLNANLIVIFGRILQSVCEISFHSMKFMTSLTKEERIWCCAGTDFITPLIGENVAARTISQHISPKCTWQLSDL